MTPQPERALAMTLADVETAIGEALLAGEFGSKDASVAEKRAVARRWFESNVGSFRTAICGSAAVKESVAGPGRDRNALLGALIDVLDSQFGMTVPVAALAVMLMYWGLDRLCPDLGSSAP